MLTKEIEHYMQQWNYLSPSPTHNIFTENNQNQMNTTGAQNLKEFDNTAGWLSVFFCNELIK